MGKKNKKQLPVFTTDKEAEDFVDTADLSEYDLSGFKKFRFEFMPKSRSISLRLSEPLYQALQAKAKKEGIQTQKLIRQALESTIQS